MSIAVLAINPDSYEDESAYTDLSGDLYTMVMVAGATRYTKAGSAERYY